MTDNEPLQLLNKKNTLAIHQQVKHLEALVLEQTERINGLVATINTLTQRLNSLEQINLMLKVKMTGTGPSVKE